MLPATTPDEPLPPPTRQKLLRISVFSIVLALWTWKLLEPSPVPDEISERLARFGLKFAAAKSLHLVLYAILTILAITLPIPRRGRYFLVGLLVWHGVATEIGQRFVPNRTGTIRDVLIDWCGIALGLLVAMWWNRRSRRRADAGELPR